MWLWLAAGLWPGHTGRAFNSSARRVARLHGLKNRDIWAPPPRQTRDLKSHQFLVLALASRSAGPYFCFAQLDRSPWIG
jgi:hypothetical protein